MFFVCGEGRLEHCELSCGGGISDIGEAELRGQVSKVVNLSSSGKLNYKIIGLGDRIGEGEFKS